MREGGEGWQSTGGGEKTNAHCIDLLPHTSRQNVFPLVAQPQLMKIWGNKIREVYGSLRAEIESEKSTEVTHMLGFGLNKIMWDHESKRDNENTNTFSLT